MPVNREEMDEIRKEARERQLYCVTMERLRKASGYKRLGPGVNKEIVQLLGEEGLGHSPQDLSGILRAEAEIYVYPANSKVAEIISAVNRPTQTHATRILKALEPEDAEARKKDEALAAIRDISVQIQDALSLAEQSAPEA